MPAKKKTPVPAVPEFPKVIETFRKFGPYEMSQLGAGSQWQEPSCWNGNVTVRRYRITVELIEEPKEVLEARLQKLWHEEDNHHNWNPLQAEARRLGIELNPREFGRDKKAQR